MNMDKGFSFLRCPTGTAAQILMVYISSPFAGFYGESFILFIRSTYLRMGTEQQILREKREYIVKQHVDAENRHDVVASIATFHTPRYQVFPMGIVHDGANAVGELLSGIFKGFPDFTVEIVKMHHSDDAVILEIKMEGTHRGDWAGLKATGRKMDVPVACIFEFDGEHLMCEKVYFDMATLMNQLSA